MAKKKSAKKVALKKKTKKKAPAKKAKPASGTGTSAILQIGTKAPTFKLPSDSGKTISLKDFAGKTVVLYFYPKDSTPGCTQESCDFRDSFSRVKAKGAVVLGVSKDSVASHVKFKTKYALPFPLLSDESGKVLESYGVWKEKSLYGRKFMGIERTTYLIDVNAKGVGTIWKAYPKVKVAGHVDDILSDLEEN
jgi:thioredoxin-dependent peroxiredoxin